MGELECECLCLCVCVCVWGGGGGMNGGDNFGIRKALIGW